MLTEKQMWRLIESAHWATEGHPNYHNYEAIGNMFIKTLPKLDGLQICEFITEKYNKLRVRYHGAWLNNRIVASDDSWSDLAAEVVARGEAFYKTITVKKLQKIVKSGDFYENFLYITHNITHALDVKDMYKALCSALNPKITRGVLSFSTLRSLLKNKVRLPLLLGVHPLLDEIIAEELKDKN